MDGAAESVPSSRDSVDLIPPLLGDHRDMAETVYADRGYRRFSWCLPGLTWAAGMWISFGPVMLMSFGVAVGGPAGRADPRLVHYALEHGYRWLARYPSHLSFWDPPIFFPQSNVFAFSDVLIGAGVLYWPWRLFGFPPDVSLLLWLFCVCAANFAACYWLLRTGFRFAGAASSVGAYLFCFGSIRLSAIGHLQLLPQLWVLLGLSRR